MKGVFCMTKSEELKILEAIEGLILEAGPDSYIRMTFAGVPEVCRRNIENDFGNIPVQDLEDVRKLLDAEERHHDETKRMLAESQKIAKDAIDQRDKLLAERDEWEQNAHDAGEMYAELEQENAVLTAEIRKLKAEIVRMRMERMDENAMAHLYDRMNEEE